MNAIANEVARRRTFAIISHPDAGKTTLTEKLLLFGGAIQLAGAVKAPVRVSGREEAGAAGAAMMAAVAVGAYPSMDDCIAEWVTPLLGTAEPPDPELVRIYDALFPAYVQARGAHAPVWDALAERASQPQSTSELSAATGDTTARERSMT